MKPAWIASLLLLPTLALAASTFTTNYDLEKPSDGSTSWGSAIRDDLDAIDTQMSVNATGIADHLADTVGAHAGTAISATPGAELCTSATTVQAFLDCLDTQIESISPGSGVSVAGTQTITGDKTFSGDVTLSDFATAGLVHNSSAGLLSSSTLVNADVSSSAAIALSKLAASTASVVPIFNASGILSASAVTSTELGRVSGVTSTLCGINQSCTVTNKSFSDSTTLVVDASDATKTIAFDAGGTTGTKTTLVGLQTANRTLNLPDDSTTLVGASTVQTLSNKELTSPTITSPTITGTGSITATTFTGALTGNASTATALASNPSDCASDTYATTIAASGNLTCATVTNAGLAGSIADTKLSTISTAGKVSNSATTATDANTASAIVARDSSGNFSAGTISAALTGNASTATALAANPADCASDTYATTIAASGALTCATVTNAGLAGSIAASKLVALTASKAVVSDGSGFISAATTTATQIGYLSAATGTTGTSSTNIVFSTTPTITKPNIVGTVAVDNASAGSVGEIIESDVITNQAFTSDQRLDVASITLTAGDWDVNGSIRFIRGTAVMTVSNVALFFTAVSGNVTTGSVFPVNGANLVDVVPTSFDNYALSFGPVRVQSDGTNLTVQGDTARTGQVLYLKGYAGTFNTAAINGRGMIRARRVR